MATSLSPDRRSQLDGIVQKMQANGETDDYIQGVVNDFKTKYAAAPPSPFRPIDAIGAAMGGPGQGLLKITPPSMLPAAGGIIGGIGAGVPGAIAGGALGRGAEDVLTERPTSFGRMAQEGARQGAWQVAGTGLGVLAGVAGREIGPLASKVARMGRNPIIRELSRTSRLGLPLGGALTHGIPGAMAGIALPLAGRAAMGVAMSPKTAAFLGSEAFRTFARQSPRAAAELYRQLVLTEQPDATQQPTVRPGRSTLRGTQR
jgi:hypothetical protein